ncbi:MAG: RpiB/LacA/LacB family sugar-phosphate isomerase [Lachnospiraceae bacterium]|nr:RpiB/LacA/LacB family sugar-phosphate isomerase [Lachnospiraceae bacterium]
METQLKLVIGSDLSGYDLKIDILERMKKKGYDITDYGSDSAHSGLYPEIAKKVANAVAAGEYDRGILICGTGQGMAMASNKVRGIRAALCYDVFPALMSREHNNANILATGSWLVTADHFERVLEAWLFGKFDPNSRHQQRLASMLEMENER